MTENDQNQPAEQSAAVVRSDRAVERKRFPVIGIGASAGGVNALTSFFDHLRPDSDMAFVVILHLPPAADSKLPEILQRHTKLPVQHVAGPVRIDANQIYIVPPNKHLEIVDGTLQLLEIEPTEGTHMPVDHFFRALATGYESLAGAIVLSGSGSDGTIGIKRIKEAGGVTLVQDPGDAEFDGMPRMAISTGLVDYVLPVAEMPGALMTYWRRAAAITPPILGLESEGGEVAALREIFAILRVRTGHDFSEYKRPTVSRRITRRMQVTGANDLETYLGLLRSRPEEVQALLADLLISVTNFFRDLEAWVALQQLIPQLFVDKGPNDQVRVWVVACATCEEAYSVAMLLREHADTLEQPPKLQVFATDIDDSAIATARLGVYPSTIAGDVSPERLRRFFLADQHGYRIKQEVRDLVLFARHNVLHDPPFSRIDLVSCRNMLIYLNREAQDYVLHTFHFSLRADGFLLLGGSESVDGTAGLFNVVNKPHRLYQRRPGPPAAALQITATPELPTLYRPFATSSRREPARPVGSFAELHGQLASLYTPPSVIVNDDGDIIHLGRGVGQFLHFGEGQPSHNLLKVVLPDLRIDLRTTFLNARREGQGAEARRVPALVDGATRLIDLIVQPISEPDWARGYLLVVFHDVGAATTAPPASGVDSLVSQLEAELDRTRLQLRATIEQYEAAVEEHKAANEELQAINEELRAASEELETSKEELQSINEELSTVNQELKHKVDEVSRAHNDLQNLISSTQIGTIFLDRELHIKRYTPSVQSIFNVIPADLTRPLEHVTHTLLYDRLAQDAIEVLHSLATVTREVQSKHGQWYMMRLLPYRTLDDRIEGVVMTFVDISERKRAEEALRQNFTLLNLAMDATHAGWGNWNWLTGETQWSESSKRIIGFANDDEARHADGWLNRLHPEDRAAVEAHIAAITREHRDFNLEYRVVRADGETRWLLGSGRVLFEDDAPVSSTGIVIDITERKQAAVELERLLKQVAAERDQKTEILESIGDIFYALDHEFNLIYVNRQCEAVWGRSRDDLLGKHFWTEFPEIADSDLYRMHHQVLATGQPIHFETISPIVQRWISVSIFPRQNGGLSIYFHDVHQHKLAEEALRESEERFRTVANLVPDLLWSNDAHGVTDWYNRRWLDYTGQSYEEAKEYGWLDAIHSDDREQSLQRFQHAVEQGTPLRQEHRIRNAAGEYRWFLVQLQPLVDEHGKVERWYGAATDIDEQRRALAGEQAARAEAEAALATRDQFLSIASHELRTPLTTIMGYAGTIRMAVHNNKAVSPRQADAIMRQAERLNALISQLLDVSRLQRGQFVVERKQLDIVALTSEVVQDVRESMLPGSVHAIEYQHPGEPLILHGDYTRLSEVVHNLLGNAVKYSPNGGVVRLCLEQRGGDAVLEVSDQGIGIPDGAREQLFNAFYRAPNAHHKTSGFGLGLYILGEIVRRHGGRVEVESVEGDGSTFRVILPLALAETTGESGAPS